MGRSTSNFRLARSAELGGKFLDGVSHVGVKAGGVEVGHLVRKVPGELSDHGGVDAAGHEERIGGSAQVRGSERLDVRLLAEPLQGLVERLPGYSRPARTDEGKVGDALPLETHVVDSWLLPGSTSSQTLFGLPCALDAQGSDDSLWERDGSPFVGLRVVQEPPSLMTDQVLPHVEQARGQVEAVPLGAHDLAGAKRDVERQDVETLQCVAGRSFQEPARIVRGDRILRGRA